MKRTIITLLATAAGALAIAAPAGATANCHGWQCVNRQLTTLQAQVKAADQVVLADNQALESLATCIKELPVSDYGGNGSGGYVFDNTGAGTYIETSALDVTQSGDPVGAWFMVDACNSQQTASIARAHTARQHRALDPLATFERFGSALLHWGR